MRKLLKFVLIGMLIGGCGPDAGAALESAASGGDALAYAHATQTSAL